MMRSKKIKEEKNKMNRQEKGITLIALVVTIVVLLILAGVSIGLVLGDNGIIGKAKEARDKYAQAVENEKKELLKAEDAIKGVEGFEYEYGVNKPKLKAGMIPVYYDTTNKVWKKADESNKNKQWYDYDNKKWANIVTVAEADKNLRNAEVGTEIPMDKITTFFVWVPRYAYSITSGYKQGNGATGSIDVTFLKGNTNIGTDGVTYGTDYNETKLNAGDKTPKIVHPGFKLGNSQVAGIWVAKFEASGTTSNGTAVGNADGSSTYNPVKPDSTSYVKILPSKISWRDITIGESEYRCMQMSVGQDKYGWTNDVNSHLIKNDEWGAVAYLCYSKYGSVPKTNGAGTRKSDGSYRYNLYTGAGAKGKNDEENYTNFSEGTYGYNTELGRLASTTGNEYGIYDMAGGAWEMVAGYLDNGNNNLNIYGGSTSNSQVQYFENGKLKSEYSSLWNVYEVSEEEKNNKIKVGTSEISQNALWSWNNKTLEHNTARLRLTQAIFNNMAKHKGIGVNETTADFSYYAPYGSTGSSWGWFKTAKDTKNDTTQEYGRTWNNDYMLIGHASNPFVIRGGGCSYGSSAGVLCSRLPVGNAAYYNGFRPVLAF